MYSSEIIKVKDLNYTYQDQNKGLKGVTFNVQNGEKYGIIGPNGAGKSTTLLHLNGILIGQGTVEVDGLPVESKNLKEVRRKVALVFQNPDDQLFCLNVYDDVAFGLNNNGIQKSEIPGRVSKTLEMVGLQGFESRNSYHLSLGEKKRASIATVLAMKPEILLLDEPFAGLDPRGRRELLDLLESFPHTMIIATHDLEAIRKICGRVLIIDNGKSIIEGKSEEILEDKSLLDRHGLA